jgi:hypothetical protein
MRIKRYGRLWDVYLDDGGSPDTLITVQPMAAKDTHRRESSP